MIFDLLVLGFLVWLWTGPQDQATTTHRYRKEVV